MLRELKGQAWATRARKRREEDMKDGVGKTAVVSKQGTKEILGTRCDNLMSRLGWIVGGWNFYRGNFIPSFSSSSQKAYGASKACHTQTTHTHIHYHTVSCQTKNVCMISFFVTKHRVGGRGLESDWLVKDPSSTLYTRCIVTVEQSFEDFGCCCYCRWRTDFEGLLERGLGSHEEFDEISRQEMCSSR